MLAPSGCGVIDNSMRLTLLKSGNNPDSKADMGSHAFTYALLPHMTPLAEGPTIGQGLAMNL